MGILRAQLRPVNSQGSDVGPQQATRTGVISRGYSGVCNFRGRDRKATQPLLSGQTRSRPAPSRNLATVLGSPETHGAARDALWSPAPAEPAFKTHSLQDHIFSAEVPRSGSRNEPAPGAPCKLLTYRTRKRDKTSRVLHHTFRFTGTAAGNQHGPVSLPGVLSTVPSPLSLANPFSGWWELVRNGCGPSLPGICLLGFSWWVFVTPTASPFSSGSLTPRQ